MKLNKSHRRAETHEKDTTIHCKAAVQQKTAVLDEGFKKGGANILAENT